MKGAADSQDLATLKSSPLIFRRLLALASERDEEAWQTISSAGTHELSSRLRHLILTAPSPSRWEWPNDLNLQSDNLLLTDIDKVLQSGHASQAEFLHLAYLCAHDQIDFSIKQLAQIYEENTQYDLTVLITREILRFYPRNTEAIYQLAFALNQVGEADAAIEALLPLLVEAEEARVSRLAGVILKRLGRLEDSIYFLEKSLSKEAHDPFSVRFLAENYVMQGYFYKALELLHSLPINKRDDDVILLESSIHRHIGDVDTAISVASKVLRRNETSDQAVWTQAYNYSISDSRHSSQLIDLCSKYFRRIEQVTKATQIESPEEYLDTQKIRIGFLTGDLGEHVVSRFLFPLLRGFNRDLFEVEVFSTLRRFEEKSTLIATSCSAAFSLEGLSLEKSVELLKNRKLDIIIETGGYTANSGLVALATRCAAIQCEYIGFHATTGFSTIDYFIGDDIITPASLNGQFTETLLRMPSAWISYDQTIEFPNAISASQRESPVFGCFSQTSKINRRTIDYWAAALSAVPESILVLKDRGYHCDETCKRIGSELESRGVSPARIYFFGHVATHLDHLDAYNAIDISLDTTPWCGATTAFESLGMGVPMVTILGDTTSARMSSSVVTAAGLSHLVAETVDQFASIAAEQALQYKNIRAGKLLLQKAIRAGVLFDEKRFCTDFYGLMKQLVLGIAP